MLIAIDNLLDRQMLLAVREQLEDASWVDNRLGAAQPSVQANEYLDDASPLAHALREQMLLALSRHGLFISAALPHRIYAPRFNCYRDGGHYGTHIDASLMTLPDGSTLRTDLSATLFLSDPDEYEGGELLVETEYGAQSVKLDAGDLILYPSTSLHEVTPVTAGARLASFFWIQSMVRDNHLRALLFDLDQSIQALTMAQGESNAEVVRLSGVYHNLVRLWSEV